MIVRELIGRIQAIYSRGVESDDSRLSNRHTYNKLVSVRSRLISEKFRKKQYLRYQTLSCIELIDAPISECCCIPETACKVRRSKYPLPKLLLGMEYYAIKYVTQLNGKRIEKTGFDTRSYVKGNKYAKEPVLYYIQNQYLYIIGNDNLEIVMMKALFEDAIIPQHFINCCEEGTAAQDCTSPLDQEFHIDGELIEPLIGLTIQEIPGLFIQGIEDVSNNASDTNVTATEQE